MMPKTSRPRAVTIKDVARHVGFSHQVVSKILNGGSSTVGASMETRRLVLEAAEGLQYRPNRASRLMRRGSMQSVGILVGEVSQFYLQQAAVSSLCLGMARAGYASTLVSVERFDAEHILKCSPVREHMVDLLFVSYVFEFPHELQAALLKTGLPVVWLMRNCPLDAVYIGERQGANMLGEHLVAGGQRHIATVDFSHRQISPAINERLCGLADIGDKYNLSITHYTGWIEREKRYAHAIRWLQDIPKPVSIIAHSIAAAQLLVHAAFQLGFRVPDDIAIASFDQGTSYLVSPVPITCAVRSDTEFGFAAADLALEKLQSPGTPAVSRCNPYHLVQGGTTVPVP